VTHPERAGQEGEDLVPGRERGMSLFVHEMGGDHAVRGSHHVAEERRRVLAGDAAR
jgi:hypothetical protein